MNPYVFMTDSDSDLPFSYVDEMDLSMVYMPYIVDGQEFVDDLFSTLRERQMELKSGPVVFVGGGAILLRRQIENYGKVPHPIFVEDICANAKGYELLYRFSHPGR